MLWIYLEFITKLFLSALVKKLYSSGEDLELKSKGLIVGVTKSNFLSRAIKTQDKFSSPLK